jgi:uncharacterized membrane protein
MYVALSESFIKDCAETIKDETNNNFIYILKMAKDFKDAGLSPFIFLDTETKEICVTSKERIADKLH